MKIGGEEVSGWWMGFLVALVIVLIFFVTLSLMGFTIEEEPVAEAEPEESDDKDESNTVIVYRSDPYPVGYRGWGYPYGYGGRWRGRWGRRPGWRRRWRRRR